MFLLPQASAISSSASLCSFILSPIAFSFALLSFASFSLAIAGGWVGPNFGFSFLWKMFRVELANGVFLFTCWTLRFVSLGALPSVVRFRAYNLRHGGMESKD